MPQMPDLGIPSQLSASSFGFVLPKKRRPWEGSQSRCFNISENQILLLPLGIIKPFNRLLDPIRKIYTPYEYIHLIATFCYFGRLGFRGPSICSGGVFFNSLSLDAETCFVNFIWATPVRIARSTIASSRSSNARSSSIRSAVACSAAFSSRLSRSSRTQGRNFESALAS